MAVDIAFTAAVDEARFMNTTLGSMIMSGVLECMNYWLEETNLTKMSVTIGTSWKSILHTQLGSHTGSSGNFEEAKALCLADTACTWCSSVVIERGVRESHSYRSLIPQVYHSKINTRMHTRL